MPNSLDSDQAQHIVKPDLGPNCLQILSVAIGMVAKMVKSAHGILYTTH